MVNWHKCETLWKWAAQIGTRLGGGGGGGGGRWITASAQLCTRKNRASVFRTQGFETTPVFNSNVPSTSCFWPFKGRGHLAWRWSYHANNKKLPSPDGRWSNRYNGLWQEMTGQQVKHELTGITVVYQQNVYGAKRHFQHFVDRGWVWNMSGSHFIQPGQQAAHLQLVRQCCYSAAGAAARSRHLQQFNNYIDVSSDPIFIF